MNKRQIAVIGGGPSGLAAAVSLTDCGLDVALYDAGLKLEERDHERVEHLAGGIGGAGLFSDGKFSFFPSGTSLYHLPDQERLRRSYEWCVRELDTAGIASERFPDDAERATATTSTLGLKPYPSHYASLDARKALVRNMVGGVRGETCTTSRVTKVRSVAGGTEIVCEDGMTTVVAGAIVATGRFGGFAIERRVLASDIPIRPGRVEIGLRIESRADIGFLTRSRAADLKRIWRGAAGTVRTFCTCRNGEVWYLSTNELGAISGRSDGPPSGFSNFGLLVRFEQDELALGRELWAQLEDQWRNPFVTWEPIAAYLGSDNAAQSIDPRQRPWFPKDVFRRGSIAARMGPHASAVMRSAIEQLLEWSPDLLHPETVCLFPAIEGVGAYPETDADLRVPGTTIWCAGDVTGRFRGLVPSMVSGYYAGLAAAENMRAAASVRDEPARITVRPAPAVRL